MEIKIILARLVANYNLTLEGGHQKVSNTVCHVAVAKKQFKELLVESQSVSLKENNNH